MDLEQVVRKAQDRDLDAFADVTRQFQHMAFGYALSFVRNFQEAEDVVQEAFVAAWYALPTLAEPAAFPGWFRSIVRHRAHRVLRRRSLELLPLTAAEHVAGESHAPEDRLDRRRQLGEALDAITRLPA